MFIYSHISLLCTVFPGLLFSNNFPILVEFKRKSPFLQFSCFCLKLNVSGIYFSIGRNFDCWQLKLILHMFWVAINMFLTILVEFIVHVCCCFIFCSNFSVFYTSLDFFVIQAVSQWGSSLTDTSSAVTLPRTHHRLTFSQRKPPQLDNRPTIYLSNENFPDHWFPHHNIFLTICFNNSIYKIAKKKPLLNSAVSNKVRKTVKMVYFMKPAYSNWRVEIIFKQ